MKIGVVGCGQVGSASAYACVMRGIGSKIVLVDMNPDLAHAQAEDILHATPFASPMQVQSGAYEDLVNADIVMIAAGVGQKTGETRLDLLKRNADVFRDIIPEILNVVPSAILVIASNPVDIMTHMAAHIAREATGHDSTRVIGSGTILDTARFRSLVAQHLGVSSHSVHGYVIGEHGDSEILHWSGMTVGNIGLENFAAQIQTPITQDIRDQIDNCVRNAAYRIIQGKGATWYGIGAGMNDERAVMTCCTHMPEILGISDVTLSLPRIISRNGVQSTIIPELDEQDTRALKQSAEIIKEAITQVGF
jgi:L-lactate dehydrogenase